MKAIILTEGGTDIGFGHIYRCAAITHGLRKRSIECTLIINGDSSLQNLDIGTDFSIKNWMLDIDNIKNLYGDTVIIDSYKADKNLVKKVAALFKLSVYIDDYKRMIYPSGIVINSAIGADHLNYPDISGVEYLLGLKYHPMRMEFWECEKKSINRQVNNILITIGGSDMKNITPAIIKELASKTEFKKKVVIGRGFTNIREIMESADSKTELIQFPDAKDMFQLMQETDITISASGQTLFELARIGVPTIAIGIAKNQELNIRGWMASNFIEFAGWWYDEELGKNVMQKLDLLMKYDIRINRSETGRTLIDGAGALRIAEKIMDKLKTSHLS